MRSVWISRAIIAVIIVVLLLVIAAVLLPSYWGFYHRGRVNEALDFGGVVLREITEFHRKAGRLPSAAEAPMFRRGPTEPNRVQSIVYDPDGRMIVVALGDPFPGKRVAMHAEERDGVLTWRCRTIDLEPKHLPAGCR